MKKEQDKRGTEEGRRLLVAGRSIERSCVIHIYRFSTRETDRRVGTPWMRYVVTWWTRFEEIIRTQVSAYRRLSLRYKEPPLHCFYSGAEHKMSFTAWERNPPTNSYWKLLHFQVQITCDVTLYVYIKLLLVSPRNRVICYFLMIFQT